MKQNQKPNCTRYKLMSKYLKVRQSRNVFFKPTILPKNEGMNSVFLPNSTMIALFRLFFGRIRG